MLEIFLAFTAFHLIEETFVYKRPKVMVDADCYGHFERDVLR